MNNIFKGHYDPESHAPHNVRTTSPHMGGLGGRFRPISMSKGDLAQYYFPGRCRHGATNQLRDWINRCHGLPEALTAAGYSDHQRMLSARQVRLIVEYLGEP